jgi:serine/threonine protein kinase
MTLAVGTRLGPYEVTALIGEGGMGKVWRAHHTALKRDDALKVLPDAFASDPERLARFRREAQVLASLNHPNIAHVHGLEQSDGVQALVMELVEGPTLADRIAQGPIPVDEALPIAKQIAEALEAAHEQGVIHRDLKPANIKVRSDGTVKVLDFGLAKALDPASATGVDATASPTITSPAMMTGVGMLLGTAAYMSPEQARGKAVDKRSDIWAFGCVLYEMLTGTRAFLGDDVTETIALVLTKEPDWTAYPSTIPLPLLELTRRCLTKDPRQRLRDIGDARIELQTEPIETSRKQAINPKMAESRAVRVAVTWALIGAMAGAAITTVLVFTRAAPSPSISEIRLEAATPGASEFTAFAISPDGRMLVYQATTGGRTQLWTRALNSDRPQPVPSSEGGNFPFWSPDSRSIAFFADSQLKRFNSLDGSVQTLTEAPFGAGGTWSAEGTIVFNQNWGGPLYRVSAAGGQAIVVTRLDPPRQINHVFPHFLPDGRHFIFFAHGTPAANGIYLASLDSISPRLLVRTNVSATFAAPDRILFVRDGALMAQRIDVASLMPVDDPQLVASQVAINPSAAFTAISASAAGPIAYRASAGTRQLVWMDRSGREITRVGDVDAGQPSWLNLSRDGRQIALFRTTRENMDVWAMDVERGALRRITSGDAWECCASWSPDGTRLIFSTNRNGMLDLAETSLDDPGVEKPVLVSSAWKNMRDWSPDGRTILFSQASTQNVRDIWALNVEDGKPFPVVHSDYDDGGGRFSPDGRWIVYQSNETGRYEVYVQRFPGPGGKVRVSSRGAGPASWESWRQDGRELYYMAPDNTLVAVPMDPNTGHTGAAARLFEVPAVSQFVASHDGVRFLFSVVTEQPSSITLLLNWSGRSQ